MLALTALPQGLCEYGAKLRTSSRSVSNMSKAAAASMRSHSEELSFLVQELVHALWPRCATLPRATMAVAEHVVLTVRLTKCGTVVGIHLGPSCWRQSTHSSRCVTPQMVKQTQVVLPQPQFPQEAWQRVKLAFVGLSQDHHSCRPKSRITIHNDLKHDTFQMGSSTCWVRTVVHQQSSWTWCQGHPMQPQRMP